jgi:hypothetical protein
MKTLPSDPFLRGYLLAAMFTEDPNPVSGDFVATGRAHELVSDIPEDFLTQTIRDCEAFRSNPETAKLLSEAVDVHGRDLESCGSDLWYSRNGHGVGFWDRGLGKLGKDLHAAAKKMGEAYLELA